MEKQIGFQKNKIKFSDKTPNNKVNFKLFIPEMRNELGEFEGAWKSRNLYIKTS